MIPHEKALVEKWKDRPFALVGINSDQGGSETLRKKLTEQGISWRNAVEGSTSGPIASEWNVKGWPTLVVIDAEGVIRWRGHGGPYEAVVEEWMKKAEATPTK